MTRSSRWFLSGRSKDGGVRDGYDSSRGVWYDDVLAHHIIKKNIKQRRKNESYSNMCFDFFCSVGRDERDSVREMR